MQRIIMILTIGLLFFNSKKLYAVEWQYTLFSNIRYSDNLNQTIDEISGYALNAGFTFNLSNDPESELAYVASGLYGVTRFSQNGIDDQIVRGFNGNLVYQPENSNFSFLAVENISQVPQNRFVTQEINNIRDIRVTAAKPSYFFNLTDIDKFNFDYSYIIVDAANTAVVNAQNGSRTINEGSFSYEHQINTTNSLSIIGRSSDTNYDSVLDPVNLTGVDYTQQDIVARWRIEGQSNLLRFDYGRSTVKTELDRNINVDLIQLLYRRQINRNQALSLTFRRGFDSVFNFELGTNNVNVNNRSGDFGNTLRLKENRINYEVNEDFFTARISYFNIDLDSALSPNTETRKGIDFRISYRLSRILNTPYDTNIAFTYFKSQNQFDSNLTQVTENKVSRYNLFLNYFISEDTFLFLQLQLRNSDSFIQAVPNANIDSRTIFVGLSYSPNGRVRDI